MSLPLTVTLSFSLLIKSSILVAIEATEGAAFISGGGGGVRGVVKGTFGTFCLSSHIFGKCQTFCGAKSAKSAKLLKKSIDFMYNRQPGPSHPHLRMF